MESRTEHHMKVHGRSNMNNLIFLLIINVAYISPVPVTVTAYNAVPGQTDSTPFITASNTRVRTGICAVSRDLENRLGLRFGDMLHLEGIGPCEFQDRMHRRKRNQVDLFMWKRRDAIRFGRQRSRVLVMPKGEGI